MCKVINNNKKMTNSGKEREISRHLFALGKYLKKKEKNVPRERERGEKDMMSWVT